MEHDLGEQKVIPRELPDVEDPRAALVGDWLKRVEVAKGFWKDDFKRMRLDMEFAKLGSDSLWRAAKNYTANILQRHINQKVASLYAKNPRAVIERSERLDFKIWDGTPESLMIAQQTFALDPFDPTAQALIQDVMQGIQRRKMFDKIGKTMVIMFHYFLREGNLRFKRQAKQAVRRALVTGIAYCEVGFQRLMEKRPEVTAQINDVTNQLATLETLAADLADGEMLPDEAEAENLKNMLALLQEQPELVVREGPIFDWPKSTKIIPDPNTVQIDGWIGTNWLAREYNLTPQQIKETYEVDVSTGGGGGEFVAGATGSTAVNTRDGNSANVPGTKGKKRPVYKVWDKRTGTEFVITEGWPDFLKQPSAPDIFVEQFFPVFPIQFNPVEDDQEDEKDTRVFGLSEIELLRDMQMEYNRARQGLREHRHANRPGYVAIKGALEPEDKSVLTNHPPSAVAELNSLMPGQKIEDLIQPIPKIPIDPAVYDVSPIFDDVLRSGGQQEANLGGLKGGKTTATESSIAESSRSSFTQSNVDDQDDFLTDIARATGQIMLMNISRGEVEKIAGPGAVWPEFTAQEVAEEMFLETKVGSAGRPNKSIEIANFERMAPLLIQIPGVKPQWLAEKAIERLGDKLEIEEAFLEGIPSIIAQNGINQAMQGPQAVGKSGDGTASAPGAQGPQGAQNAPAGPGTAPGPQPAFPAGGV
jgi:hypothetical protein